MKAKSLLAIALALAASAALSTDFVWTGNGSPNDQWQIPGNWSVGGAACTEENQYPHTSEDTATFNSDARVLVASQTTIGELVISEGANFTHVRDQFLQVGMLSGAGTLKLQNRARFDFVNSSEITVLTTIDVSTNDPGQLILVRGTSAQVNYEGGLTGTGTVQFEGNVKFTGDNSGFEGVLQIHTSSTVEFLSPSSGSALATVSYSGNNKKTSHINLNGDIYFGAFKQTSYGAVDFRVNLKETSKIANLIIGGNGEDSIIMGSWGDANNNSDRPNSYSKITKVGDETLQVYCPWHRLGTEIRGGVLEVIGPDALTGRNTSSISPISFTGGTLKYGTDTTTNAENPTPVTTDWSALVKDSTEFISVDTAGNAITWANESLYNNNNNAKGIQKIGEGTLELSGSRRDGSWKFFTDASKANYINGGVLAIRNGKNNETPNLASKILGTGTLRIVSEQANGGYRLYGESNAFNEFAGTLEWANELDESGKAVGFMLNNAPLDISRAKVRITGNPESDTIVMNGEVNSTRAVTVGAFDHLYPNAILKMKNPWKLNIIGTKGDSYLNGKITGGVVTVTKTGSGKLSIGPGFSAPEGSAVNVDEGSLDLQNPDLSGVEVLVRSSVTVTGRAKFGTGTLKYYDETGNTLLATYDGTKITTTTANDEASAAKVCDMISGTVTEEGQDVSAFKMTLTSNGNGTWSVDSALDETAVRVEPEVAAPEVAGGNVAFTIPAAKVKKGLYYAVATSSDNATWPAGAYKKADGESAVSLAAALPESGVKFYKISVADKP